MKKNNLIVGIDIGGSHITAGLVEMNEVKVVKSSVLRKKLNSHGTADEIITVWINTIRDVIQKSTAKISKLGFAMPGPFDYEKGICLIKDLHKYEALYGMNIKEILAEALQTAPENILFRNDAEAFLAGELYGGAAKGFQHAIGITLGTGLGSAISHKGVTVDAELGVMPYKGEIIEEFVSTRGLLRIYKELTGQTLRDVKEISELYETDMNAQKAFEIFSNHLAFFLKEFINREKPEVLVAGGNIANSWNLFMNQVISHLEKTVSKMPVIVKAVLAEDAAIIGGACSFISVQTNTTSVVKL